MSTIPNDTETILILSISENKGAITLPAKINPKFEVNSASCFN